MYLNRWPKAFRSVVWTVSWAFLSEAVKNRVGDGIGFWSFFACSLYDYPYPGLRISNFQIHNFFKFQLFSSLRLVVLLILTRTILYALLTIKKVVFKCSTVETVGFNEYFKGLLGTAAKSDVSLCLNDWFFSQEKSAKSFSRSQEKSVVFPPKSFYLS